MDKLNEGQMHLKFPLKTPEKERNSISYCKRHEDKKLCSVYMVKREGGEVRTLSKIKLYDTDKAIIVLHLLHIS